MASRSNSLLRWWHGACSDWRTADGQPRAIGWRRGTVSIEFAAVSLPFLLMISGMIEFGISALSGAVLDDATREAARQIRTGQAQESADPIATFRDRLCSQVSGLLSCDRIVMDVRSFPHFGNVSVPPLYDSDGNPQPSSFSPGEPGEIVVARASLRWTYQTPLLAHVLGGGDREITSTLVFRNEPYKGPL